MSLDFYPCVVCGGKLSEEGYEKRKQQCSKEQLASLQSSPEYHKWEVRRQRRLSSRRSSPLAALLALAVLSAATAASYGYWDTARQCLLRPQAEGDAGGSEIQERLQGQIRELQQQLEDQEQSYEQRLREAEQRAGDAGKQLEQQTQQAQRAQSDLAEAREQEQQAQSDLDQARRQLASTAAALESSNKLLVEWQTYGNAMKAQLDSLQATCKPLAEAAVQEAVVAEQEAVKQVQEAETKAAEQQAAVEE